jgi:phosphate transport system ATP-binding protein
MVYVGIRKENIRQDVSDATQSSGEAALKCENVNVWYAGNHALKNVNLNINKNCITAFIGPSGCGKTTLLKCFNRMNDLVESFRISGKITHCENDIYDQKQDVNQLRKQIGMVFQQPNPFPKTIYENIKLPIVENLNDIKGKKVKEIVLQKLKDANLFEEVKERLHSSALRLSGGQQQRLCIARALSIDPDVLLFDEPCAALDTISTLKIEDLLMELKKKYTIVIVTHNLQQATRIADYVAFFYKGEIIEQNNANEIFMNPRSEVTQDYFKGTF